MRTRAFIDGAAFAYLNQAIVILTGLWLTPFLLRRLGQTDYGVWLICLQVLGYAMLADFGTVALLPREVAFASGESDEELQNSRLRDLMGRTVRVVLAQTAIVAVLAVIASVALRSRVPVEFRAPLLLMAAGFVLFFPLRIFPAALEGLQDMRTTGKLRTLAWAVATIAMVAGVLMGARIYALAFGWIVTQAGYALACYWRLRMLRPELAHIRDLSGSAPMRWSDTLRGGWISVGQIAQLLISGTDLLIAGRLFGAAAVVRYNCTGKMISVLSNQPMILIHAALPGLSQMRANESRARLLTVSTAMGQGLLLMGGAVGVMVLCLNRPFITVWVGARFYAGAVLTLLFVLNTAFRQMDLCFSVALFAFGYEKPLALKALADGVCGIAFAVLLGSRLGLPGVAAGLLLSALAVALPVNVYFVARECSVSPAEVLRPYLPWLWRFALGAAVAWWIARGAWIMSWPHAFLAALTGRYCLWRPDVQLRAALGVLAVPSAAACACAASYSGRGNPGEDLRNSASARNALPRWLTCIFSAGVTCANVRLYSG